MLIREAEERDIPALERVKALGGVAHADRVHHVHDTPMRVLLAEDDGEVVGYAFLLLGIPPFWKPRYVPQLVDLQVREDCRDRGYGTALVHASEALIRDNGGEALYLAVDPDHNPRTLALYRRLGYVALDQYPVDEPWRFADSSGTVHSGIDHVIYMRKVVK
jgi:GNAT superfamily N-acetyltransferase